MRSSELRLSDLPSPGFYVYTCRAASKCGGKDMISEKDVQFIVLADENSTVFTTVKISSQIVLIPGQITVVCPSILTENSGLIAKNLQWFRLYRQVNMVSSESNPFAHHLSHHDLINGTVTTNHSNFIAYQQQQGRDLIFAMNIKPSSFNDFGYYGCAFGATKMVGHSTDLVLSQISAQPVCLVRNTTGTTIRLSPFRSEACYYVGEILSVECEAMAYQAFCVEDDKPLGVGLLSTVATLKISRVENATTKALHVASAIITGANPPKKLIYFSPVLLNISYSHNNAILTCEVRPEIGNKLYNFSTDWNKLQLQLIRRATAKICVFFPPSNIIISPPPPDQVSEKDVAFVLNSEEWVTCLASGNPAPLVSLDAYPLRKGAISEVMRLGLSGIGRWRDPARLQPNWPTAVMRNDTGSMMLVKKELGDPKDLIYVGVCHATNEINGEEKTAYKLFVFRIRDTTTNIIEGSSFYRFMAISFFTAILGFVLTTFILEIAILSRRSRRTNQQKWSTMLKPLYQFRTKCCGNDDAWQYALRSRAFCCQFCGTVAKFASLPCEMLPPVRDAHTPVMPGTCPVRVAFIPSDQNRGFLNFAIGDELHCGVIDTKGCVRSYSPHEGRFCHDRSRTWKQSIVCEFPETGTVDGALWDRMIEEGVEAGARSSETDCLDFAVSILNRTAGRNEFTRERLGENMGRQLYHVMQFAEAQKRAMQS
ncbi:hypothetical protein ECG_04005 [Echinococcus granulosus]|nr:hypothetical protein ECG_04005 [Echinococcus granulosus]